VSCRRGMAILEGNGFPARGRCISHRGAVEVADEWGISPGPDLDVKMQRTARNVNSDAQRPDNRARATPGPRRACPVAATGGSSSWPHATPRIGPPGDNGASLQEAGFGPAAARLLPGRRARLLYQATRVRGADRSQAEMQARTGCVRRLSLRGGGASASLIVCALVAYRRPGFRRQRAPPTAAHHAQRHAAWIVHPQSWDNGMLQVRAPR